MRIRQLLLIGLSFAVIAAPALGDGSIKERGKVKFGKGFGLANKLGGSATRDGLITEVFAGANEKRTRAEDRGIYYSLVDEIECDINYKKERATCKTFAERREENAQTREMFAGMFGGSGSGGQSGESTHETEFEKIDLGAETVNGFETQHDRWIITTREKGKTLEEAGGAVVTVDLWIGPEIPVQQEIWELDQKYLAAIDMPSGEEMAQLVSALPVFQAALNEYEGRRSEAQGSVVRSELVFESVVVGASDGGSSPGGRLRGIGKKIRLGRNKDQNDSGSDNSQGAGGGEVERIERLRSSTEIVDTSTSGNASIPAGFKVSNASN